GQGETVWAVYYGYWPEDEFTQDDYDFAIGVGTVQFGFKFYGIFDLRCDQGAYELLGLDSSVNYVAVAAYFATEDDAILASHFEMETYPHGQIEVYCAD
ncbi:MAG: hypothetical protein M3094_02630, partial [Actinomycetia bacterium]|nr:hypothetical protein [Actinomycetes bacterium]